MEPDHAAPAGIPESAHDEPGHVLAVSSALIEEAEATLGALERALERLDDGSYGRCEICDAPIGPALLERLPAGRRCAEHLA